MSSGTTEGAEVALLDQPAHDHVLPHATDPASEEDSEDLPVFGEALPEDEIRKIDPHMTRPLEPEDLKPAAAVDASRLTEQIAHALENHAALSPDEITLLGQRTGAEGQPRAEIRLHPGTTRRKIAGTGVTPEPLVVGSEATGHSSAPGLGTTGIHFQDLHHAQPPAAFPPVTSAVSQDAAVSPAIPDVPRPAPARRMVITALAALVLIAFVAVAAFFLYHRFVH